MTNSQAKHKPTSAIPHGKISGLRIEVRCMGSFYQWRLCDSTCESVTVRHGRSRTEAEARRIAARIGRNLHYRNLEDAVNAGYRKFLHNHHLQPEQFNAPTN